MNFYISDLHFGHANILTICNRPFSCVEEMDEYMIRAWNKTVNRTDKVYIVGDLIFRSTDPNAYLDRLRGEKHLLIGNHDVSWMNKTDLSKYFKSVERMAVIATGKGKATLCHFPMLDFEGKYLIHGHTHKRKSELPYWDFLKNSENVLNAGADINGYKPVSMEELMENNRLFKLGH